MDCALGLALSLGLRSVAFEAENLHLAQLLQDFARDAQRKAMKLDGDTGKYLQVERGLRPAKPTKPRSTFSLLSSAEFRSLPVKCQGAALTLPMLFDKVSVLHGPARPAL